jgi:hypothetical protein
MGNFIHDLYRNIKGVGGGGGGGVFTRYLKLCTPTLFIEESSSSTSSKRLATLESFPSMNCFRCIYCSGTATMSRRVAFSLMLSN